MPKTLIKPQFIEVEKKGRLVVISEEDYDNLLDMIDNVVAERIEKDESDPVISLKEAEKKLFGQDTAAMRKRTNGKK